ncbi:MAG: exonuclease domain-containing protein [Pseudomonadota bacterium]
MVSKLSLRLRIFLFFGLLAAGAAALAGGALYVGWSRAAGALSPSPFVTAFFLFAFLNTGLAVAVWFLFDENIAKPIEKLAADLRLCAHSGVDRPVDAEAARYLGDLAPAAGAVSATLNAGVIDTAQQVARETERLQAETAQLTALLSEIPVATILMNAADEIVLYDAQAAEILSKVGQPRLKASVTEYLEAGALAAAHGALTEAEPETAFEIADANRARTFSARLKRLDTDGYILTLDPGTSVQTKPAARPLVYDFDLLETTGATEDQMSATLSDLCFVVFDSETTGLSTTTDDVVQIGAVRILNGRIVPGETFDTYVDPGRPIPPASTRIHQISDADVAGAPDFLAAGRRFHAFCRDAVLVAHNAPFDLAFLHRREAEMGVAWNHPVLDTVLISAMTFGITEEHTLDALCERLDATIPPEVRHSALGDAIATAEVFVRLLPLLEAKDLTTLGDVVAESRKYGRLIKSMT